MSASIDILPVWKKDATAAEWLQELAAIALTHPERFGRSVIVYEETLPNGNTKTRTASRGSSVSANLGLLEFAKADMIEDARR